MTTYGHAINCVWLLVPDRDLKCTKITLVHEKKVAKDKLVTQAKWSQIQSGRKYFLLWIVSQMIFQLSYFLNDNNN